VALQAGNLGFVQEGEGALLQQRPDISIKSINVTSVAMRFKEELMPAIHQKSLGLVVVTFFCI
jgi:hypothetical protein